jgi:hypothetical protein
MEPGRWTIVDIAQRFGKQVLYMGSNEKGSSDIITIYIHSNASRPLSLPLRSPRHWLPDSCHWPTAPHRSLTPFSQRMSTTNKNLVAFNRAEISAIIPEWSIVHRRQKKLSGPFHRSGNPIQKVNSYINSQPCPFNWRSASRRSLYNRGYSNKHHGGHRSQCIQRWRRRACHARVG